MNIYQCPQCSQATISPMPGGLCFHCHMINYDRRTRWMTGAFVLMTLVLLTYLIY